jgi:hypothetical protein
MSAITTQVTEYSGFTMAMAAEAVGIAYKTGKPIFFVGKHAGPDRAVTCCK